MWTVVCLGLPLMPLQLLCPVHRSLAQVQLYPVSQAAVAAEQAPSAAAAEQGCPAASQKEGQQEPGVRWAGQGLAGGRGGANLGPRACQVANQELQASQVEACS